MRDKRSPVAKLRWRTSAPNKRQKGWETHHGLGAMSANPPKPCLAREPLRATRVVAKSPCVYLRELHGKVPKKGFVYSRRKRRFVSQTSKIMIVAIMTE